MTAADELELASLTSVKFEAGDCFSAGLVRSLRLDAAKYDGGSRFSMVVELGLLPRAFK